MSDNKDQPQNYEDEHHIEPGYVADVSRAASWLLWVAGCTLINAVCFAFHVDFVLALGLSLPLFSGALLAELLRLAPDSFNFIAVIVAQFLLLALLYWFLHQQAKRYRVWALIVGMSIMLFDMLLAFLGQMWISIAIHGYMLWIMINGIKGAIAANKSVGKRGSV